MNDYESYGERELIERIEELESNKEVFNWNFTTDTGIDIDIIITKVY